MSLRNRCARIAIVWSFLLAMTSIASAAPTITALDAVIYRGHVYVVGELEDPNEDVDGAEVFISGDIETTVLVRSDGYFGYVTVYPDFFGQADAFAIMPSGEESDVVQFEFQE